MYINNKQSYLYLIQFLYCYSLEDGLQNEKKNSVKANKIINNSLQIKLKAENWIKENMIKMFYSLFA